MEFEDKLDYLTKHTYGVINNYIRDLIKEYYSLKNELEDLKNKKEEVNEELEIPIEKELLYGLIGEENE